MRRVLQRVDGNALDAAIGSWLAARDRPPLSGRGRQDHPRGRHADGTQVHLLAAMSATGLVTAQHEVDSKTNEITVFRPMLAELDLSVTRVTFEALHSHSAHPRFLVEDKKPTTLP